MFHTGTTISVTDEKKHSLTQKLHDHTHIPTETTRDHLHSATVPNQ